MVRVKLSYLSSILKRRQKQLTFFSTYVQRAPRSNLLLYHTIVKMNKK